MAHSKPTNIDNMGDAWRLTTTAGAFVIALVTDIRVEAQYLDWLRTREKFGDIVVRAPLPQRVAMWESWRKPELAATERLIAEQVPAVAHWKNWLAPALISAWECRRDGREFSLTVSMRSIDPAGRKPRAGGDDLIRNAGWLYRAEVKAPPDSIKAIAQEYNATLEIQRDDTRSVVQNGVKQARALLDILGRDGLSAPIPPYLVTPPEEIH